MATGIFSIDQAGLQQVAALFQRDAELMDDTFRDLSAYLDQLRTSWVGEAATAFFDEMDNKVLPVLRTVTKSFVTSSEQTKAMIAHANEAEDAIKARFSSR